MPGTIKRLTGPKYLSNTLTTDVYNNSSALLYDVVTHIHIVNKTDSDATFSLWIDATGENTGGKEIFSQESVKARKSWDWYGRLKLTTSDFLVGGASAASTLAITVEGEQYAV